MFLLFLSLLHRSYTLRQQPNILYIMADDLGTSPAPTLFLHFRTVNSYHIISKLHSSLQMSIKVAHILGPISQHTFQLTLTTLRL